MSTRIRAHIRSNIVGYIAVFIALSGAAYAADGPLAGQDSVGSADIIDSEVMRIDIGANSIGSAKVIANSLTGADLADDTVSSSDVSGIWGPDVIPDGLTGADIKDLTGADVALNTLGSEDVRQEGLRGEDIDEGTLNFARNCATGAFHAWGLVSGVGLPAYGQGYRDIEDSVSCRPGQGFFGGRIEGTLAVDRRDAGPGRYRVFSRPRVSSKYAIATSLESDNIVSVSRWTGCSNPPCTGSFNVTVRDNGGSFEDDAFWIAMF